MSWLTVLLMFGTMTLAGEEPLAVATFRVDATPPLGSPLCDGLVAPAEKIVDPLRARGVVLLGAQKPIVLIAVDWVGIGNEGLEGLAQGSGRGRRFTTS